MTGKGGLRVQQAMHRFLKDLTSKGLRSHLVLVVASILVPVSLFAIVAWQDRLVVFREADADVEQGADSVREHALKVLQTDSLIIALIDQRIQSMSWDEIASSRPVHDYLVELVQQNPELEGAWIADPNGTVRNSSRLFPVPPRWNVATRDVFTGARSSDQLLVGERVQESVADSRWNDPHFHVAQRRTSGGDRFDGIIALMVSSSYFPAIWQQSWHNSPQVLTELVSGDLKVLARLPPANLARLSPDGIVARAIGENLTAASFRATSRLDGIERVFAYRRVEPYAAYVLYGISLPSILSGWYRHLIIFGGIFGLAALALATVSLVAATRMQRERVAVRQWRSAIQDLAAEAEQRRIVEKQLFEAEKLETLGQVAGGFAHDFGNVLMAVHLNLESLRGQMSRSSDEATLNSAIHEVERGSEAVRSLLIFARHGSLETQVIDPRSAIQLVTGLLQQAIGAHSVLETSIDPGLWPIKVNANQLELALLNLAVNARDAMPDGGTFRITAGNVHLDGIPEGLSGEFVVISASDTGCGMSPEILAKAIEPFFTTKEEGKGTGLGLSQVYGFAKHCGGTTTLESTVGHGTTVKIYIPRFADWYHRGGDSDPMKQVLGSSF